MPWRGGSSSFSFSSWHHDFQASLASCLHAKNRFPQGWGKAGDNGLPTFQKDRVLSFNGTTGIKMLLIEANDKKKKSLFRFLGATKKASKHFVTPPKNQKKNMNALRHWWHQDSVVTIPCLRAGRVAYQQERDKEVDWFKVRVMDIVVFNTRKQEREGEERWNGGILKWHP